MKEKIRLFLIDFVRILMLYLGIRLVLEYIANSAFDPVVLLKSQLPPAALLAGLASAIRLLLVPKKK
jgi:hypothetical protein